MYISIARWRFKLHWGLQKEEEDLHFWIRSFQY